MSHRDDGHFGFTVIEINAELETIPGGEAKVEAAAKAAEQRCLIANALDVPVHVAVSVKTGRELRRWLRREARRLMKRRAAHAFDRRGSRALARHASLVA